MLLKCIFDNGQFDAAMKLTMYTDYAIRVMAFVAAKDPDVCSIREIADAYGISRNHLMKVVQDLSSAGYVAAIRGRNGGIRLGRAASEINLGDLLRHTEGLKELLDCGNCPIRSGCGVPSILREATAAFVSVFDKYFVSDIVPSGSTLRKLLFAA